MQESPDIHPAALEIEVLLPLPLPQYYSYAVGTEWEPQIQFGIRVEVPFGNTRLYAGLIVGIRRAAESQHKHKLKSILSVLDQKPLINAQQLALWEWVASYYCCTVGEVMQAALPAGLKLDSETRIQPAPDIEEALPYLNDLEYLVAEALQIQGSLSLDNIRDITQKKNIHVLVQSLLMKGAAWIEEKLKVKYKARTVTCVRLTEAYAETPAFEAALNGLRHSPQIQLLLAYSLLRREGPVLKQPLLDKAGVSPSPLQTLIKNGILEVYNLEISRLQERQAEENTQHILSPAQQKALEEVEQAFEKQPIVLLHGVTGSGKTNLYIELIKKTLLEGGQVLFLLPEIALTSQLLSRLEKWFGQKIQPYHSRLNSQERVEIWNAIAEGQSIVIGARSALFLPFSDLRLVIVDEEHDASYKQQDPAPRYQGRDTALYLASKFGARTLLASATPSLESYTQALAGKYGLVELPERYGDLQLPEIRLVDLISEQKRKTMRSLFSQALLEALDATLEAQKQAILFQNRRGYSPYLGCEVCDYTARCIHCDVNLTYFRSKNLLKCTYCGYQQKVVHKCPSCGTPGLQLKGTGTEKVEDELQILYPELRIARLDQDSTRLKGSLETILEDFAERRVDVLAGTQMVTKGLDFDHIALVGVIQADALLQLPDFRASERAFQLLAQVAGRAGRKGQRGLAIIQTSFPHTPLLQEVIRHDYQAFYKREMEERKRFHYPPFSRLIELTFRHPTEARVQEAADVMAAQLKQSFGGRILGPAIPGISRIQNQYIRTILVKAERNNKLLAQIKAQILAQRTQLLLAPGMSKLRIVVDVDGM